MSLRRGLYLLVSTAIVLASPCAAHAGTRTITMRYGPVTMGGFNVEFPKSVVRAPGIDGYVVGMHADLEDAHGRTVTIHDVMLHHTVFFQHQRAVGLSGCAARRQEAFYGTGEENESLRLPAGYGYRTHPGSGWTMHAMLMSHSTRIVKVYVRYRVTVVTGRQMQSVRPFWVRA